MTTPTEPNGMTYPTTPCILVAGSAAEAARAALMYGIDIAASTHIAVVYDVQGIEALSLDGRPWAVADAPNLLVALMTHRFGQPVRQADIFAPVNNNVVLRRARPSR